MEEYGRLVIKNFNFEFARYCEELKSPSRFVKRSHSEDSASSKASSTHTISPALESAAASRSMLQNVLVSFRRLSLLT
jgi:hypothetical protein